MTVLLTDLNGAKLQDLTLSGLVITIGVASDAACVFKYARSNLTSSCPGSTVSPSLTTAENGPFS